MENGETIYRMEMECKYGLNRKEKAKCLEIDMKVNGQTEKDKVTGYFIMLMDQSMRVNSKKI